MEKKEYQSPKMEVVEMPYFANLLQFSEIPVDIEEPNDEDRDEDC